MNYGFVKVAAASPKITVADTEANAKEIIKLSAEANSLGVKLCLFPELSITGATCGELFYHKPLTDAASMALFTIAAETAELDTVIVVGAPVKHECKLYNCAVVIYRGEILGIVPKTGAASSEGRTNSRIFAPAPEKCGTVELGGIPYPFGNKMLFYCEGLHEFNFACEFKDELFSIVPASCEHTRAGASVICCLAASGESVGKAERVEMMVLSQSARTHSGYIYADAGLGESTTDKVYGGQRLICENGKLLNKTAPFCFEDQLTVSEIDVCMLCGERTKDVGFDPIQVTADNYYSISFDMELTEASLTRHISASPFVPDDKTEAEKRCSYVMDVQAYGLAKRIEHTGAKCVLVGISGGLDSTLALLVSVRAMELLGRPRADVVAVTMPCFGTANRTRSNAEELAVLLHVSFREIDIKSAVNLHLSDISHDGDKHDVVYENAQARERTQVLMDIANDECGFVVGTGDLSELCLGWATFNGDHMSMYGVNAGIPKTLIRRMVEWYADNCDEAALAAVLCDVVATPISPELLPGSDGEEISQKTEEAVGPYELHDFFVYYFLRYNFSPDKILHLALHAFAGKYDEETVGKWLNVFVRRFFGGQFKRTCLPDGPSVGSVSISPRCGLSMPSDASYSLWETILY